MPWPRAGATPDRQHAVLVQRVLDLEAMNKQLEEALLHGGPQGGELPPSGPGAQDCGLHSSKRSGGPVAPQQPLPLAQQQEQVLQREAQQEQAAQLARAQVELRMAKERVGALEAALALAGQGGGGIQDGEEHMPLPPCRLVCDRSGAVGVAAAGAAAAKARASAVSVPAAGGVAAGVGWLAAVLQ